MTTTEIAPAAVPTATGVSDQDVVSMAAEVGAVAARHDAVHDRDATFVTEAYDAMRATGYLRLGVPVDLGGGGATLRQLLLAQEELGRWSGSASLSSTMHHYLVMLQCWRRRRDMPGAEATLRKVVDGLVMATSGGSDWVSPTTVATEVEGGYRFDGRKVFCSQSTEADVISTSAVLGEPGPDAQVLHAGVPLSSPGIQVVETWDTLGMRGTASHDIVFDGVFVATGQVLGTRPFGSLSGPLMVAAVHFAPLAGATYLGIAQGACDEATRLVAGRTSPAPSVVRQIGEMRSRLRVAHWALLASLAEAEAGADLTPDLATLATLMIAKRHAVVEAVAVTDLALSAAGGASFFRASPLERAYRDVRGGPFHPLTPEATLDMVGRSALVG